MIFIFFLNNFFHIFQIFNNVTVCKILYFFKKTFILFTFHPKGASPSPPPSPPLPLLPSPPLPLPPEKGNSPY